MGEFFTSIIDFINETQVPEQIREVEAVGLFTNAYFLVPFLVFIGYQCYKKQITTLGMTGLFLAGWLFCGSPLMQGLIVDGELQLGKVLPVAAVGVTAIAVFIYLVFIRSD